MKNGHARALPLEEWATTTEKWALLRARRETEKMEARQWHTLEREWIGLSQPECRLKGRCRRQNESLPQLLQ